MMMLKGISTLNDDNSQLIKCNTIQYMVVNNTPNEMVVTEPHKTIRIKHRNVVSRQKQKTYRTVYIKRKRTEHYDILPFGYKKP